MKCPTCGEVSLWCRFCGEELELRSSYHEGNTSVHEWRCPGIDRPVPKDPLDKRPNINDHMPDSPTLDRAVLGRRLL